MMQIRNNNEDYIVNKNIKNGRINNDDNDNNDNNNDNNDNNKLLQIQLD